MKVVNTGGLSDWREFLNELVFSKPQGIILYISQTYEYLFNFSWGISSNTHVLGEPTDDGSGGKIRATKHIGSQYYTLFFDLTTVKDRRRFREFVEKT